MNSQNPARKRRHVGVFSNNGYSAESWHLGGGGRRGSSIRVKGTGVSATRSPAPGASQPPPRPGLSLSHLLKGFGQAFDDLRVLQAAEHLQGHGACPDKGGEGGGRRRRPIHPLLPRQPPQPLPAAPGSPHLCSRRRAPRSSAAPRSPRPGPPGSPPATRPPRAAGGRGDGRPRLEAGGGGKAARTTAAAAAPVEGGGGERGGAGAASSHLQGAPARLQRLEEAQAAGGSGLARRSRPRPLRHLRRAGRGRAAVSCLGSSPPPSPCHPPTYRGAAAPGRPLGAPSDRRLRLDLAVRDPSRAPPRRSRAPSRGGRGSGRGARPGGPAPQRHRRRGHGGKRPEGSANPTAASRDSDAGDRGRTCPARGLSRPAHAPPGVGGVAGLSSSGASLLPGSGKGALGAEASVGSLERGLASHKNLLRCFCLLKTRRRPKLLPVEKAPVGCQQMAFVSGLM